MKKREVAFKVSEEFLLTLRARLGGLSEIEVLCLALSILDWATKEKAKGRVILSTNEDGGEVNKLNL